MPLRNRVDPFGRLLADPARGTLMGNRGGRLHDPVTKELGRRRWMSKVWISCLTDFRGRHREVWGDSYTELFFCDEVTAFAAGHRPCFECRRVDHIAYREALRAAGLPVVKAADMDALLHRERLAARPLVRTDDLPDGTMISLDGGDAFALRGDRALPWSLAGYGAPRQRPTGEALLLTPPTSVAALAAGYRPEWHQSAWHPSAAVPSVPA
jgi:hypothetical protein